MQPKADLIHKTAAVARAAPAAWADFIQEVRKFSEARRDALVGAPRELVQLAQGHAQMCDAFVELFENAVKNSDHLTEKRR